MNNGKCSSIKHRASSVTHFINMGVIIGHPAFKNLLCDDSQGHHPICHQSSRTSPSSRFQRHFGINPRSKLKPCVALAPQKSPMVSKDARMIPQAFYIRSNVESTFIAILTSVKSWSWLALIRSPSFWEPGHHKI